MFGFKFVDQDELEGESEESGQEEDPDPLDSGDEYNIN